MSRKLGIDFGEKRVGLALSDPSSTIAQPSGVLSYTSDPKLIEQLLTIIHEQQVEHVVLGLPKNMDGSEGEAAKRVRSFAAKLEKKLPEGLTLTLWDERLSTVASESALLEAGLRRQRRRQLIDKVSAALILQNFLDRQRGEAKDE